MTVRILLGDVRARLAELADESVHCVVTSPPYFGLRDYGIDGQIGMEATPEAYVAVMAEVFRAVRRVLRADGTLWLNLGDSYAGSGKGGNPEGSPWSGFVGNKDREKAAKPPGGQLWGMKQKDLMGIPWRVAFALQADGWYLRQDIIWAKPNPMPESVSDRCTKAHEYLFLLSRSPRYHYDAEAIAEAVTDSTVERLSQPTLDQQQGSDRVPGKTNGTMKAVGNDGTRNRRSVWTVATQPFKEAHFATFPPDLIEPCILAGCPKDCCAACGAPVVRETEREQIARRPNSNSIRGRSPSSAVSGSPQRGSMSVAVTTTGWLPSCACNADTVPGTVLDCFGGAGTTGLVADRLQRSAILIELNPAYLELAAERITDDAPLFASVTKPEPNP